MTRYELIDSIIQKYDSWSGNNMEPVCKSCAKELQRAGFGKSDVQEYFDKDGIYNEETGEGTWDKDFVDCIVNELPINSSRKINSSQEPLYWGDEHDQRGVNMYTREEYVEKYGEEPPEWKRVTEVETDLWNSRKITSARYIATDPESGEVLGSADTYEEAVNEWGEDVTITDSEAAEGQEESELFSSNKTIKSSISAAALEEQLDGQFWTRDEDFEDEINDAGWDVEDVNNEYATISNDKGSQYEVRFYDHGEGKSFTMESFKCIYHDEDDDDEIESANHLNGDKAFLSNIVSSVLTQSMTEEQAVKRIALRNNCNQAFARNILSNALEDTSLIQSGVMAIADDINKDFNIDGDINSWFADYVPREGAANTVGGEILRAFAQIRSRYYNDGDKIGVGIGKDTVNPAARYLVDKCVGWTEVSNIEEMLSGDSDINKDNDYYNEWLEDCEYSLEDYLRNNEDYFHAVNKEDMWNYKTNDDSHDSIDEVFIEDDDNNEYWFQRGGDGWHCYTINYSHQPQYEVNSWVDDLDDIPDTSGDFCDFELDGFEYSAEKSSNGEDWMITDVRLPNGIVQVDEEWEISDFEPYTIYDSQGREISINELY